MDRLDSLAFFIRVVEKNGVAAAGREFGLSAASASERLAFLENHYDAKLLNRTTRSISLTEEGRLVLDSARHLVSESNDLESKVKLGVDKLSGLITVSAPKDLGANRVAPVIDEFLELHPDVTVELSLGDTYLDLAGMGIDLGVRLGKLRDSSMIVRKIADNRRVVCAAPAYLQKYGRPEHPDQLHDHNCLIMRLNNDLDKQWAFRVNGRHRSLTVSGNRIANSGATVRKWCIEGYGIALKSIWDVGDDLKEGRLVELLADYRSQMDSALQLVYPGGKPTKRVRALIEHLSAAFKP